MSYTLGVTLPVPAEPVITAAPAPYFDPFSPLGRKLWAVASVISAGAGAFHGYRRNQSIGWALGWAILGGMFPVIVPAIALAQGFGKPKAGFAPVPA